MERNKSHDGPTPADQPAISSSELIARTDFAHGAIDDKGCGPLSRGKRVDYGKPGDPSGCYMPKEWRK